MHVGNTCVDDCITSEMLCLRDCLSYLACSSNARAGARGDHIGLPFLSFLSDTPNHTDLPPVAFLPYLTAKTSVGAANCL